jgi:RimJ/RimL family protein N-acetyltransferase
MPDIGTSIVLRAATGADRFMLRRWLSDPAVATHWGNSASGEAEITLAMESSSALCRIVEWDGQPAGYCHAVDAGLWGEMLPSEIPPGCWDIDLFVGAPEHRGRGIERHVLDRMATEVFATTLAVACCIFVSVKNEPAVRAYEHIGFRWIKVWPDPILGPCWVLIKERPSR